MSLHLWHLNELFVIDENGIDIAKVLLTGAVKLLWRDETPVSISIKIDGMVSIVVGWISRTQWQEYLEAAEKRSRSPERKRYLSDKRKRLPDDSLIFVVGYKGALNDNTRLFADERDIENSIHAKLVKDILKVLLKQSDLLKKPQQGNLLIQADVVFYDQHPSVKIFQQFKIGRRMLCTPNLLTYETLLDSPTAPELVLFPHTAYKNESLNDDFQRFHTDELTDRFTSSKNCHIVRAEPFPIKPLSTAQKRESIEIQQRIQAFQPLLTPYYAMLRRHSKLGSILLRHINAGIKRDRLVWKDAEYVSNEWFTYDVFLKTQRDDLNFLPDRSSDIINQVFLVFMQLAALKERILTIWNSVVNDQQELKPYRFDWFHKKLIPSHHEGFVLFTDQYLGKMVSQHRFSRDNFHSKTQNPYFPQISPNENSTFVASEKKLFEIPSDRILILSVGRFNPPTIGHEKLFHRIKTLQTQLKLPGNQVHLVGTESQGDARNPIPYKQKVSLLKSIVGDAFSVNDSRIVSSPITPESVVANLCAWWSKKHREHPAIIVYVGGSEYADGEKKELAFQLQSTANHMGFYFIWVSSGVRHHRHSRSIDSMESISGTKVRALIQQSDSVSRSGQDIHPKEFLAATLSGDESIKERIYHWTKKGLLTEPKNRDKIKK